MPDDRVMLPRTGNYISGRWLIVRHRCWRDRIPWYGTRHLLAIIEREEAASDGDPN